MNEFIEKLISRLEETKFLHTQFNGFMPEEIEVVSIGGIKNIVNRIADEYSENIIIDGQYCWQSCACVEKCKECNRLSNGDIDWYENIEDWND